MRLILFFVLVFGLLVWILFISNVVVQVIIYCFFMNEMCLLNFVFGMDYNFVFNVIFKFEVWEIIVGFVKYFFEIGVEFIINKQGDLFIICFCFYIFWGCIEIWFKVVFGCGIISFIMLLSDNLDEIDWEFFGGNFIVVQSNYFGKN